uniref:Uncharacterized protein n=1 Tax=Brassica oleracea TaxID=3712 RepID=A0A3P6F9J9_BRAOL|nr:unnamed protein product [Brassica oleracea]
MPDCMEVTPTLVDRLSRRLEVSINRLRAWLPSTFSVRQTSM